MNNFASLDIIHNITTEEGYAEIEKFIYDSLHDEEIKRYIEYKRECKDNQTNLLVNGAELNKKAIGQECEEQYQIENAHR